MIDQIREKINKITSENNIFEQEKDVVYFCVELRKFLEREEVLKDYPYVNFYCDWCVHPVIDKEGSIKRIKTLIDLLETGNGHEGMYKIIHWEEFRDELSGVCDKFGFSNFTGDLNIWDQFTMSLKEVLLEQPIEIKKELGFSVKSIKFIDDTGEGKKNRFALEVKYWPDEKGGNRGVTYSREIDNE
jgi:hypothetical protein